MQRYLTNVPGLSSKQENYCEECPTTPPWLRPIPCKQAKASAAFTYPSKERVLRSVKRDRDWPYNVFVRYYSSCHVRSTEIEAVSPLIRDAAPHRRAHFAGPLSGQPKQALDSRSKKGPLAV